MTFEYNPFTRKLDKVGSTVASGVFLPLTGGTVSGAVVIENTLSAGIRAVTHSESAILTANECRGTIISNYAQASGTNNIQTFPVASEGLNGMVVIGTTVVSGTFSLKPNASDKIYLDGVALADGNKATMSGVTAGNFFTFFSFQTTSSSFDWIVRSSEGTLRDGGA